MKDNLLIRTLIRSTIRAAIKDPDNNIPRILKMAEKADKNGINSDTYAMLRQAFKDPENNWNIMVHNLLDNVDPEVLEKLVMSLGYHSAIASANERMENIEKYDCNIPWAILMDPTAACNLDCAGCWAAEYGKNASLSYETMDRIIREGKALGTYTYLFTGGEPTIRRNDLMRLAGSHPECAFISFTNGTLFDEELAEEIKKAGNFLPAFSIEGNEEDTDSRRGKGTYQAVIRSMDLLKSKGIPFGFSTCYTSKNIATTCSDEFLDLMIEKGCYFGWYFAYVPVGKDAVSSLIPTAVQREEMYYKVREWRRSKPCFLIDFWNDGELVNGCIGSGRHYMHINANGDVEPCAFIHYSNVNINDCSLLEALHNPLFMQFRKNQPFSENMLRVCPMVDIPEKLREVVRESGAHSTELAAPETAEELTEKTEEAAKAWKETADRIWYDPNEKHHRLKTQIYE